VGDFPTESAAFRLRLSADGDDDDDDDDFDETGVDGVVNEISVASGSSDVEGDEFEIWADALRVTEFAVRV
jgi:hypothetical protein